jgi:hypothetical protein
LIHGESGEPPTFAILAERTFLMPEETVSPRPGAQRVAVRPSSVATISAWTQIEKRSRPGIAPDSTMLVGPAVGEASAAVSEGSGQGEPRLVNGIAAFAGRWVIPTTRRIRGITQGGIQFGGTTPGGGGSEGVVGAAGLLSDPAIPTTQGRTLIVSSDPSSDVVFFPAGGAASELKLVLRGWKAGFTSPDDEEGAEVPTALTLRSGHYCVVTTDASMRMQRAAIVPWSIPTGSTLTHSPQVIGVLALINAQIKARGLESVMPVVAFPSPA